MQVSVGAPQTLDFFLMAVVDLIISIVVRRSQSAARSFPKGICLPSQRRDGIMAQGVGC
jgi:hypothetical protein